MANIDYSLCFKALSDQTRLKIVEMLISGKKCACKLLEEFNITQPTLSYHMKTLVDSGLVKVEREGTWNHYSLNADTLDTLETFINTLKK